MGSAQAKARQIVPGEREYTFGKKAVFNAVIPPGSIRSTT